jgi:DNA ligase 1
MAKVLEKGGEGLMIKDPKCRYEHKRSDKLLKVKTFIDSEAKVLGHEEGSGRCENMLGALRVKDLKSGVLFKIGSGFNDETRLNPPKIGSIVTYKYQNLSDSGIPRFPIFLRVHPGM